MSSAPPFESRDEAKPSDLEARVLIGLWLVSLAILFGGATAWIVIGQPENANWIWGQMLTLATLPGKYVIFSALAAESPLGPWSLALLAVAVDFAVATTLAVGLGPLGRVPWLGPGLRKAHDRAEEVLVEYPRLRRMAFWGVVIFVYLPLPASGSIGGTFIAQLVGLRRIHGLGAVLLGGSLVSATFAGLAIAIGKQAETMIDNPWVGITAGLVLALVVYVAYRAARDALRRK